MSFGEQMQRCRETLGLSQTALAKRLGVSQSTIGNYEADISFPKQDLLLRLFDCLETDPNTLFQDSFRTGCSVLSRACWTSTGGSLPRAGRRCARWWRRCALTGMSWRPAERVRPPG